MYPAETIEIQDGVEGEISSHFESLVRGTNPRVSVWEPDALNKALEDAGHAEHNEKYACAVVSFNDEKSATTAHIRHAKKMKAMVESSEELTWAGPCDVQTGVKAEPLLDTFACLLVAERKQKWENPER